MRPFAHTLWSGALAILVQGCGCGSGTRELGDGSQAADAPAADGSLGDASVSQDAGLIDGQSQTGDGSSTDGAFQPRLIATFDTVTRAFDIAPRAHREATSLTISGARFGDDLLTLDVLASPVQVRTYQCSADSLYFAYVHLGVAWVSRADMPCMITFAQVPMATAEIASGTFSGTLVRQDGEAGTMLVEDGSFEVQSEN